MLTKESKGCMQFPTLISVSDPDPFGSVSFWPPGFRQQRKSAKITANSHKNQPKSQVLFDGHKRLPREIKKYIFDKKKCFLKVGIFTKRIRSRSRSKLNGSETLLKILKERQDIASLFPHSFLPKDFIISTFLATLYFSPQTC